MPGERKGATHERIDLVRLPAGPGSNVANRCKAATLGEVVPRRTAAQRKPQCRRPAAKIDRTVPYKTRQDDPDFAAAYDDALDEACDGLELEARRRAHDGIDEPVVYQGELCGSWVMPDGTVVSKDTPGALLVPLTVKKYSDSLLMALLKAHRPEKFRDNVKLEHMGTGKDGAIRHDHTGQVSHEHSVDPAALAAFRGDLVAAGLGHLLPDGGAEPVDPPPAASQAAAVPAAH